MGGMCNPPDPSDSTESHKPSSSDRIRRWTGRYATQTEGFWNWTRHTARLWGSLAFILIIVIVFRSVIMPFALALLVAYILAPLLSYLSKLQIKGWHAPRFVWIILVYIVLLGLIVLFFTALVPRLSNDIKRVVQETPAFWKQVRQNHVPQVAAWVQKNFPVEPRVVSPKPKSPRKPDTPQLVVRQHKDGQMVVDISKLTLEVERTGEGKWTVQAPRTGGAPSGSGHLTETINQHIADFVIQSETRFNQLFRLGQQFLKGILSAITTFILVLMISAFLLVDSGRIVRWFRNLVPPVYFQDFDNVVVLIDKGLNGAIRGQFFICIINGILTYVGLHIIGVKYPLLLGLLAGVMSLIPIFGSIISSIPIVIVALVSGDHGVDLIRGVLILTWIIGIHLLEANVLNPKIMGSAAKIHPVLVVFAVVAGEQTYGAVGALLGVPLFSAVQAVFLYLRRKARGELDEGEQEMAGENGQEDPGT